MHISDLIIQGKCCFKQLIGALFTAKALYPDAPIRISQTGITVPEGITWAGAPGAFWAVMEQMAVVTFVRVEGVECGLRRVRAAAP